MILSLLMAFTVSAVSFAQETYLKQNKTWNNSVSNRLVIKPFVVKSEKAVLQWNSRTMGNNFSGRYSVYVSTQDSKVGKAVLNVKAENTAWTRHSISLSRYRGKKIWVTFVTTGHKGSTLYISEIYSGVPSRTYLLAENNSPLP